MIQFITFFCLIIIFVFDSSSAFYSSCFDSTTIYSFSIQPYINVGEICVSRGVFKMAGDRGSSRLALDLVKCVKRSFSDLQIQFSAETLGEVNLFPEIQIVMLIIYYYWKPVLQTVCTVLGVTVAVPMVGTCAASQPWAQHPSSPTAPAFLQKETGLSEQEGSWPTVWWAKGFGDGVIGQGSFCMSEHTSATRRVHHVGYPVLLVVELQGSEVAECLMGMVVENGAIVAEYWGQVQQKY